MVKTERQARLCDDLSAAADKSQWLEALQEVMHAFGYAYVTLLLLPGGQNAYGLPTVIESSLPIWVVNAMTSDGALWDCPVIRRGASSMIAHGRLQNQDGVIHVLVTRLENMAGQLGDMRSQSRDFR